MNIVAQNTIVKNKRSFAYYWLPCILITLAQIINHSMFKIWKDGLIYNIGLALIYHE